MSQALPKAVRSAYTRAALLRLRPSSEPPLVSLAHDEGALRVHCVVFSKDRAMQLDAFVRSVESFRPYVGPITVIYTSSTQALAKGYEAIPSRSNVNFVSQSDFATNVFEAIDEDEAYTVFHTDDDVFFRSPPLAPCPPEGFAAFSLRLGKNTTYCYPLDRPQPLPPFAAQGPLIAWNWTRARDDFAYPLSLDGHVFDTRILRSLLTGARFTNPNELEEELHMRRHEIPQWLLAFEHSCLVSIPVNVVSSTHTNLAGTDPALSAQALNARFLAGEQFALDAMDFSAVRGAHQEIPLKFEPKSTAR